MAHIHNSPEQHDLTVSMYIFRTDFDEPRLILHWHKKLNKWMQFGGHVELNENLWQAVEHELLEETGYELKQMEVLQPADRLKKLSGAVLHPQPVCVNTHPIGEDHNHIDVGFAFVTSQEPSQAVGEGESNRLLLVNRSELLAIDKSEIWQSTVDICLFIFDNCLPAWDRVPAAKI